MATADKNFTLEKLAGDASTRSYYRMRFTKPDADPKTMIMMKREKGFDPERDDWIYLRNFLKKCRVPVPGLYHASPENGLLYLEDCGDRLLEQELKENPDSRIAHLKRAIDFLLIMQVEGTRRLGEGNPAWGRKFDEEKYMFELNHTLTWYIKGHLKKKPAKKDEARLQKLFARLIAPLLKEPTVFTHRDYHTRNILVKGEDYYVIDFQDARMGPMQYDLVSLLYDSYLPLAAEERERLLGYYFARLKFPVQDAREIKQFMTTLYHAALQRNLKALGTFGYQAEKMGKPFYLAFVPATIEYVKANLYKIRVPDEDRKLLSSLLE